jgi:molybdate transport system ATP-binding protein
MDEPLASLDDRRKAEILPYLEKLRDGFGVPIVYISHSLTEVARLSTTLILLSDGKIIRAGRTVDVMSDPELLDYLGDAELGASLTATVGARVAETGLTEMLTAGGSVYLPDVTAEQGHTVRLRLPLRDCLLLRDASAGVAAETVLTGVVADITEHASGDVIYTIGIGEDRAPVRLTTAAARAVNLEIGATCSLVAQPVLDLTV